MTTVADQRWPDEAAFALGVAGRAGFLNIDDAAEPDNWLHLVYGGISLVVGVRIADAEPAEVAATRR